MKPNGPPFHPIIYVRGFAATQGEIEETVADPYMGFNLGSTKARQVWTGDLKKFFFESPMVRLQTDHDYRDVYVEGEDIVASDRTDVPLPYRSVVIYRYYDEASEAFSDGDTPPIEHFGLGLGRLILRLRDKLCGNPDNGVAPADFRVYLVAHSMGGLVCRCFLQNLQLGTGPSFKLTPGELQQLAEARGLVDKFFTYATPHNGIDLRIVRNVPAWASFGDVNNFNRDRMAGYLGLPPGGEVSDLGPFPADRAFNLVGTNPDDYTAMKGLSAWAAGEASDGLVRIENATTRGRDAAGNPVSSPRAFVHRSHSGHYGIVNSEEGYQNLTRFLFGDIRVDGVLDIDELILPKEVNDRLAGMADADRDRFKASYQFEVAVSVRNCQWQMHRRNVREQSAIFRTYGELFPRGADGVRRPDRAQSPHLFSAFLDKSKSVKKRTRSVSLAFDLSVLVPDYTIDGVLFFKRHYEGGYIYKDRIVVEATPDESALGGWRINYGYQDATPNSAGRRAETRALPDQQGIAFDIEVAKDTRPGIKATLRIEARPWA